MYKYANLVNMSVDKTNSTVIINFLQNTPAIDENYNFEGEGRTTNELVSSIVLDERGAYNLLEGLIHVLDLDEEAEDEE